MNIFKFLTLIVTFCVIASASVSAQSTNDRAKMPGNMKEFANIMYKSCVESEHPVLKKKELEMFCGCTASNMTKVFNTRQMKAMSEDTEEGQYQRNRMLLNVYAPCIEYPTRAMLLDNCLKQERLRNPTKTCGCIADGMGEYMRENAPKAIEQAIKRDKTDIDPLRFMLNSPAYRQYERSLAMSCTSKHESAGSKRR